MSEPKKYDICRQTVGKWLSQPFQWRIPVYQRHYAWNPEKDFSPIQLFGEIVEEKAEGRLTKGKVDPHYFGAIIVEEKTPTFDPIRQYDVVDGQQRLTTINIAMFAIIDVASQFGLRKSVQEHLAKYIFNDPAIGNRNQPKLKLTNFDKARFGNLRSSAYDTIPNSRDHRPKAKDSRVIVAFDSFKERFKSFMDKWHSHHGEEIAINALIEAIVGDFELVMIPLKETDKAQKVFETLNNTSERLKTFDLIRNDVFYREAEKGFESGSDEILFNSKEWQQFEDPFWEESSGIRSDTTPYIEAYIARMLIAKQKYLFLFKRETIFKEYQKFASGEEDDGLNVQAEIRAISEYVDVYKYLVGWIADNPLLNGFDFGYFMYKTCKSMDFYPVIFTIATCRASTEEKQRMISLLESYVIRRYIAGLTSKAYNQQAPVICKELDDEPSYEKLKQYLSVPDSDTRKFPVDNEILSACLHNDFYSAKDAKQYIFARIIGHTTTDRDEKRDLIRLTIDHIMPKAWREQSGWKKIAESSKEDDIEIDRKINTIGNLTPMSRGRNAQKSNHDWETAQSLLRQCDLKMTRELADKPKWDLGDIDERSKELAEHICKIWPMDIE